MIAATTPTHYSTQNDSTHHVNNNVQASENKEHERTLAILTCSDQLENIVEYIRDHGFTIVISKQCQLTPSQAEEFYENHRRNQSYFEKQVNWLGSTMVCVMILEKENAIVDWKKLMGPSNYKKAKKTHKESIRAVFGTKDNTSQNATHGSDTEEYAKQEIEYFFSLPCNQQEPTTTNSQGADKVIHQKGNNVPKEKEDASYQDKVAQPVEEPKPTIDASAPEEEEIANNQDKVEQPIEEPKSMVHDNTKENCAKDEIKEETSVSNKQKKATNETIAPDVTKEEEAPQGKDDAQENGNLEAELDKENVQKEDTSRAVNSAELQTSDIELKANPNMESNQTQANAESEAIDFKQKTNEQQGSLEEQIPVTELEHVNDTEEPQAEKSQAEKSQAEQPQVPTTEPEVLDEPADIIDSYISTEPEPQQVEEKTVAEIEHVESEASSTDDIKANVSSSSASQVDNLKPGASANSSTEKPKVHKSRPAALKKSDAAVEPSRSRIRPPSIIRDKKGVLTPPPDNNIPKPKVNRGATRIARLSNSQQVNAEAEKKSPVKKAGVTKISKNLPRVATLSTKPQQQQQEEEEEKQKKTKKRLSSTKSFITRLTAPTVASENKKAVTEKLKSK